MAPEKTIQVSQPSSQSARQGEGELGSAGLGPPAPITAPQLEGACVQRVLNGSRIIWALESAIFNYKEKEC